MATKVQYTRQQPQRVRMAAVRKEAQQLIAAKPKAVVPKKGKNA